MATSTNPPPDIPGFYFDREKNRYFRLLANHAGPSVSFYTPDSVRKRQQQQQRSRPNPPPQKETHLRQHLLSTTPLLACELGHSTISNRQSTKAKLYASGLTPHTLIQDATPDDINTIFTHNVNNSVVFILGHLSGRITSFTANPNPDGHLSCDYSSIREHARLNGQITSITNATNQILVTAIAPTNNTLILRLTGSTLTRLSPPPPGMPLLSCPRACASSPRTGLAVFADERALRYYFHGREVKRTHTASDVFAILFPEAEVGGFLAGSRDGLVRRFECPGGRGEVLIRHGDSVRHLANLDGARVVVGGLSKCAVYDVRSLKMQRRDANTKALAEFDFGWEGDESGWGLKSGFDVSAGMGIVAAERNNTVRLFDAQTGDALEWSGVPLSNQRTMALKFHSFREGDPQALVVSGFRGSLQGFEY